MARPASDKHARLTEAAATLAYSRGFGATSIGDIAAQAGVAPGSVYYYFKTKDDVGRAIAGLMLARFRQLLQECEVDGDPRERLSLYVGMYVGDADKIVSSGCPIGSLCTELRKLSAELGDEAAKVFRLTIAWAAQQFEVMGLDPEVAQANALYLVTAIQGAAVLSNALGSEDPLRREAARLNDWIRNLDTKGPA